MSADPIVVRFDVMDALPAEVTQGQPTWLTGRVFAPAARNGPATVITCLHGGSYDWRYFHIQVPGRTGYSMAEHLAARGHVVLVLDQLGIGESARPAAPRKCGREVIAAANAAANREAYARLAAGTLHPGIAPCPDLVKVGLGHSMGAMAAVAEQIRFGTYDLLAPIGHTNLGVQLEVGGKAEKLDVRMDETTPDYKRIDRARVLKTFLWDDTPADVVAADEAMSVEFLASMSWDVQTAPHAKEAAQVTTPVFLALGERDVSPDPHAEPGVFCGSPDVTFFLLKGAAHCQNFATTRHRLWDRFDRWVASLARPLD
jgi:alpha-beta hydrolase superfamily lysophospholipase